MNIKKIWTSNIVLIFSLILCINVKADINYEVNKENDVKIHNKVNEINNEFIISEIVYPIVEFSENKEVENIINNSIQEYINDIELYINELQEMAIEDKELREETFSTYYCDNEYFVTYNKNNLLSILMFHSSYAGGAHGIYLYESFVFDLTTGKKLLLGDLFQNNFKEQTLKTVSNIISDGFNSRDNLIFEFDSIDENAKYFLTDTAIKIYFDLYEYTPYSAGIPLFNIDYSMVKENLVYNNLYNENQRYNSLDTIIMFNDDYQTSSVISILNNLNLNINDNSNVSMFYIAAKFIDNSYDRYYLTSNELETFVYHVFGKQLNIYETLENYDIDLYIPYNLELKNNVFYYKNYNSNIIYNFNILEEIEKEDGIIEIYGIITEKPNSNNEENENYFTKIYGFELKYQQNDSSVLGYNILSYNKKIIDYKKLILDEIKNIFIISES